MTGTYLSTHERRLISRQMEELREQRDQLLAALKHAHAMLQDIAYETNGIFHFEDVKVELDRAQAAIARCEARPV